jgi:hypothetical protein
MGLMASGNSGDKMKSVKFLVAAVVTIGLVTVVRSSYAIPTLFLSDGDGDTVAIAETSPFNVNSNPGAVTWVGSLGVWNLNVSTGISSGTGTSPSFDLSSVNASISGAALNVPYTLYVWFGDINLGPTSGSFVAGIGGTTTGSVQYNTYADPFANSLFGTSLGLTSSPSLSGVFANSTSSPDENLPFAYSLSQEVIITQTGVGITSFDATLGVVGCVPEGGMTLVLLGSSLIALWAFGRTHKSVRA